ncbi:MAG: hypothetical protein JRJ19_00745 [Deltaproteobacteria bacterium]|nr:hypothetical protein [Deltaproteobacteria bacterium]MBW1870558.1 hypothetical protein [Deltaproteobacteria bacterium]
MKTKYIVAFFVFTFGASLAAAPPREGVVFGIGAQTTVWDEEQHATHEGDWTMISTVPTGGLMVVGGYRFNEFFELGLRFSLGFPAQIDDDMGILLRVLPQARFILPVDEINLYASLQGGYSFFRDAAHYQMSECHSAAFGAALGIELPVSDAINVFAEAEFLYQLDAEIGDNHGFLRYSNLNISVGILF